MQKYIITGATSMIGLELCKQITSLGHFVFAVCRQHSEGIQRLPKSSNLKIVYSELNDIKNISDSIEKADVFIHLAWSNTDHEGRNNAYLQALNVEYANDAIKVASQLGCKLFVEAGSQAEYGYKNELITEETICEPELEYGKAKLRVLTEGAMLCNSLNINYLHLRIFSVFGENDRPWTLIMSAIDKMLINEDLELSLCTQNWNYLYVNDCAKQIRLLCEHFVVKNDFSSNVFNIASNETRPLKSFIEEMKMVLTSSSNLKYGSIKPSKVVSLNPSVNKTERIIGFTNEINFMDAIKIIQNKKLNLNA